MRKLFNSAFKVTQEFGVNADYYKQFGLKAHEGLDVVPTGTVWDVYALADGVVVKDEDNPRSGAYGINVTIWSPKLNKAIQYCHLSENYVQLNDSVTEGQKIGKMGSTGNSTGPHVHLNLFETTADGYRKNKDNGYLGGINPLPFLQEDSAIITQPIAQDCKDQLQKANDRIQELDTKIMLAEQRYNDLQRAFDAWKGEHNYQEILTLGDYLIVKKI